MLDTPHRRYNAFTGEWVLVSPHRAKRPWLGQLEKQTPEQLLTYDPTCYLCPRNERAGGVFNPDYTGAYVFNNDFAALLPETLDEEPASDSPYACFYSRTWAMSGSLLLPPPRPDSARA